MSDSHAHTSRESLSRGRNFILNAVGLLRVDGVDNRNTQLAVGTLVKRAMPYVRPDESGKLAKLASNHIFGRTRMREVTPKKRGWNFVGLGHKGVARYHLEVLSVEVESDDPSVLLLVNGGGKLPNNGIAVRLFRWDASEGNGIEPPRSTEFRDRETVRVKIGDTLQLIPNRLFAPPSMSNGCQTSYFCVVGLSDLEVMKREMQREMIEVHSDVHHFISKIIPHVGDWVREWIESAKDIIPENSLEDINRRGLSMIFDIVKLHPGCFEILTTVGKKGGE